MYNGFQKTTLITLIIWMILKDHVTLKTGVMMLIFQLCHHRY